MKKSLHVALSIGIAVSVPLAVYAADTPQFRGPNRDGFFAEKGLLKSWPAGGPTLAWKVEGVGRGYSSVSDVNGTIYVPGMLDENIGYVIALDENGKEKWRAPYGEETLDKQATGARATPTIDGDRLYIMTGKGVLTCMSATEGKHVWQVDLFNKFQSTPTSWGFSESPLVHGDLVYATPGGKDAALVALNKMTGETVWTTKGFNEASAYCSPAIFKFGNKEVLVTMTAKSVVGIEPATGKVLWNHVHETEYDIHAVTPAVQGNILYYTGGYGSGGGALEVAADGSSVKPLWSDKNLDCQHHGVILLDGYIYGTGHKNSKLMCLELKTGKLKWSTDEVTQGDILFADGMLYVYEGPKKGIVHMVKPNPEKFEHVASFAIPEGKDKHWAFPAIANGKLYVRHAGNLYAYTIAAK